MKKFKQLVKELPSKKVVFAFGRFSPPTTGHGLLINMVKTIASKQNADYVIFASRTQDKKKNPLPVDKKVHYLEKMFPNTNFVAASDTIRTPIEAAKFLNKKYKNLILVAGSDRVPEFTKLLNAYNGKEYNFDTIEVVSAGERDPDSDSASGMSATKMRDAASKGDYTTFKKGLPHTMTDLDGKRLMNDVRLGLGLDVIKEQIVFERSSIREAYLAGEIFNVGDLVESNGEIYEIKKRGSNHLLVQDNTGALTSKWLSDVTSISESTEQQKAQHKMKFSASDKIKVARIIASALGLEDTDSGSNPENLVNLALRKIRSKPMRPEYVAVLNKMLQTADDAGINYDKKLVPQKATVAEAELTSDELATVSRMLGKPTTGTAQLQAAQSDEPRDQSLVGHSMHHTGRENPATRKMKIAYKEDVDTAEYTVKSYVDQNGVTRHRKVKPHRINFANSKRDGELTQESNEIYESDDELEHLQAMDSLSDKDLDDMINDVDHEDDVLDVYDDEELVLVDAETGEHIDDLKEETLNEVLSRMERIKAKIRFARTAAKRERKIQIALRTRSSSTKINSRARKLAIKLMKQKLAKKPTDKLTVGEKERLEKIIEKRKALINRLAMKLAPRVRRIENDRLSHSKSTK